MMCEPMITLAPKAPKLVPAMVKVPPPSRSQSASEWSLRVVLQLEEVMLVMLAVA